jgi:hypothetical protein
MAVDMGRDDDVSLVGRDPHAPHLADTVGAVAAYRLAGRGGETAPAKNTCAQSWC